MRLALFVLLVLLVWIPAAHAEKSEESEYSREALRVKYSLFSTNIVQGPQSQKIAGMGMFGCDVEFLSDRDDDIGIQFRSYRSKKPTSTLLLLASVAAAVGSLLTYDQYGDDNGKSTALLFGGVGLLIGGVAVETGARESLSQAIWMYNGTLDTDGVLIGTPQEN